MTNINKNKGLKMNGIENKEACTAKADVDVLIVAHENCMDGLGAAYIMNKLYTNNNQIVYTYFCQYNSEDKFIDWLKNYTLTESTFKKIIFCDFSLKRDLMKQVCELTEEVEVFDHHKTAEHELEMAKKENDNLSVLFDNERSGAKICYDYAAQLDRSIGTAALEQIYEYIMDRDLWQWKKNYSKEFSEALRFLVKSNNIESFDKFVQEYEFSNILAIGTTLLAKQKQQVDSKVKHLLDIKIAGVDFKCLNVTENISEIGNQICLTHNVPSLMYFITDEMELVCSLRSTDEMIDISIICKALGGGGHRNAGGFTLEVNQLVDLLESKLLETSLCSNNELIEIKKVLKEIDNGAI